MLIIALELAALIIISDFNNNNLEKKDFFNYTYYFKIEQIQLAIYCELLQIYLLFFPSTFN